MLVWCGVLPEETVFNQLTERYYNKTRLGLTRVSSSKLRKWPSAYAVGEALGNEALFLILYKEPFCGASPWTVHQSATSCELDHSWHVCIRSELKWLHEGALLQVGSHTFRQPRLLSQHIQH